MGQAEEEVEEDLMDKMVVEADCIPGGVDGEAPDRKQVLDQREIRAMLDFGQQIKSEGNEAFSNENWEAALTRYCQGDQMLKNYRAEPHLEKENKELKSMHRACLTNKANAALKMDQWQNAIRAADDALKIKQDDEKALFRKAVALESLGRTEEALETLAEVEEIAEDMNPEIRENMLSDVAERKETIKNIESRAAQDFHRMFKAMGEKNVFSSGRFLPDGTSPPPALSGAEERRLKLMKDREEYMQLKTQHEVKQRLKEGRPLVDDEQDIPEIPTPNNLQFPRFGHLERSRTITRSQAEQLLQELLEIYSDEAFQNKVHTAARAVMYEHAPFLSRLRPLALNVQIGVLRKWGFDDTEEGLYEMMICIGEHTRRDEKLRKLADDTTRMLYGGENGMLDL